MGYRLRALTSSRTPGWDAEPGRGWSPCVPWPWCSAPRSGGTGGPGWRWPSWWPMEGAAAREIGGSGMLPHRLREAARRTRAGARLRSSTGAARQPPHFPGRVPHDQDRRLVPVETCPHDIELGDPAGRGHTAGHRA